MSFLLYSFSPKILCELNDEKKKNSHHFSILRRQQFG